MDQNGLRSAAEKAIQETTWIPDWGQARIEGMVSGRPDWCISRQRTWGVPITLFVHRETGELHPDTAGLIEQVAQRVEQAGIDAWYVDLGDGTGMRQTQAHLHWSGGGSHTHTDNLTIWRYKPMLPIRPNAMVPPLAVGWTPLYAAPRLASALGLKTVWVKDDGLQPTASFKDRASAVAASSIRPSLR